MESSNSCPVYFQNLMDHAGQVYRMKVNTETLKWYWGYLKSFPEPKIKESFNQVFEKEEFFPSIATIRKYIPQSTEEPKPLPTFAELTKTYNTGIGKDCLQLIMKKMREEITKEEYYQGMLSLDSKYPGLFKQYAEAYKRGVKNA